VAAGERLAALGQMPATVAHEVKNPLSAIKSIAQVMSEDEALNSRHAARSEFNRGETDRLSKSVTQLLSFASKQPPAAPPCRADELFAGVNNLFRAEAGDRNITLQCHADAKSDWTACRRPRSRCALKSRTQCFAIHT